MKFTLEKVIEFDRHTKHILFVLWRIITLYDILPIKKTQRATQYDRALPL